MQTVGQSLHIHCSKHRNNCYSLISLDKEQKQSRLLCVECLLPQESGNIEKKLIDLIPLQIAVRSPESLLDWMKKASGSEYLKKLIYFTERDLEKEFSEQINKCEQIVKIIEQFKQQIRQQMQEYKNQQMQFKKFRESFFEVIIQFMEKIKYNKLCLLLFQLQELDKQYQSDQYTSVSKEFSLTLDEMLKDSGALIIKEIDSIQKEHNKIMIKQINLINSLQKQGVEELQNQIIQLFQQYDQFIKKLNEDAKCPPLFQYPPFKLITNEYFKTLEQKIKNDSKKEIKQMNLIYLGSRDGLNGNAFWSKVNGKKNLIMILKSNNNGNYIFGGYSPCQWQSRLTKQFKQQIRQQKQQYKTYQAELKKEREQFFEVSIQFIEIINYNKLRQLVFQFQELDKDYQSDQYTLVSKDFSRVFDEMLKDSKVSITKEIDQIQKEHNKIMIDLQKQGVEELQNQIMEPFQQYEQYIKKLNKNAKCFPIKLVSNEYFQTLEEKIKINTKKEIKQINLIYLGQRDGLNGNAFWNKVNGKKNLLMIFKSKNNGNNVFGGYSQCQWQSNSSGQWVQDDTLTSFLFSQTHNQIYPLKQDQKQYSINCNSGYGPLFGGEHDIRIDSDFNQGYSKLGDTYQWDQYQNQNSEYLFGGSQPNIGECEIYEIIFE